jgi:arylsulfatase A-like enzyme
MTEYKTHPVLMIGRSSAVGTLVGLLVGALEGAYKYQYPNPPVLLQPSVSYVILFLGPLLDASAGGLVGLLVGLFVASLGHRNWRRKALTLGVCLSVLLIFAIAKEPAYAFVVLMGPSPTPFTLIIRLGVLLAGIAVLMAGRSLPLRILTIMIGVALGISLVGFCVYAVSPSMHKGEFAAKAAAPTGKPNIILITLDTVRADHLSLYGYPRRTTPNIDGWARKGVVFENAISPTSWTLPSHASMFTGLLPHQHGADSAEPLDPSWWTIGEVLSARGYETAGFTSNLGYGGTGWGMGNGMDLYDDDSTSLRHNLKSLLLGSMLFQHLYGKYVKPEDFDRRGAGQINRDVLRWFNHRTPRPFYLFINYFDAHEPYLAPGRFTSRFGHVSPWLLDRIESVMESESDHLHLSAGDTETLITGYDNCLASLDNSVGELIDSLSRLPGWDNTIVIITSDHGEGFGEHGAYSHGSNLYREVLRVPLIFAGPGIPSGLHISHVVRTRELFETVLQLTGMENPPFQRASLQRFWRPGLESGSLDEFEVSELSPEMTGPAPISLTTSKWQYLRDTHGNEELYNWVSDPDEKTNLAKLPEYMKVLKVLQIQLRATVNDSLRPWRRPEYLSAMGGSDRTLADTPPTSPDLTSSFTHPPIVPVGASQAFFPRRAFKSPQRPPSTDEDLLRSLPYH